MTQFARLDRLPPYVFATVNAIKMEARRAGQDIIDLGMGNPDMGTPPHIVEKLVEASQKSHNHRYSASMGITRLRTAIADWYRRRYDVEIDPESEEPAPYIRVRDGLEALIARAVFYDLVELGIEEAQNGRNVFGVWSDGVFFKLGNIGDG